MPKLITLIILIFILWYIIGPKNETFETHQNMLFTAYPKNIICSKNLDKSPLHIRVTDANGIMYTSGSPVISGNNNCRIIDCPHQAKTINDMYTVPEISHYKRLPVHNRTVCWNCGSK